MNKKLHKLANKANNTFKYLALSCFISCTLATNAQTAITVENGDFTLPGTKQQNWSGVPGWNSDSAAIDSGVEAVGTAFLLSSDPSVYSVTSHIIASDEEYTLSLGSLFYIHNVSTGGFTATLFYTNDGGTTRTPLGSQVFYISDSSWQFSVTSVSGAIGANLGIEFKNESDNGADGWHGFDNVELSYSSTLGINDEKLNKSSFNIYPNPSKEGYFNISAKNLGASVNIKAYTILGKEVLNKDFYPTSGTITVKHNLKSGIYIIKINDTSASKLIVK